MDIRFASPLSTSISCSYTSVNIGNNRTLRDVTKVLQIKYSKLLTDIRDGLSYEALTRHFSANQDRVLLHLKDPVNDTDNLHFVPLIFSG